MASRYKIDHGKYLPGLTPLPEEKKAIAVSFGLSAVLTCACLAISWKASVPLMLFSLAAATTFAALTYVANSRDVSGDESTQIIRSPEDTTDPRLKAAYETAEAYLRGSNRNNPLILVYKPNEKGRKKAGAMLFHTPENQPVIIELTAQTLATNTDREIRGQLAHETGHGLQKNFEFGLGSRFLATARWVAVFGLFAISSKFFAPAFVLAWLAEMSDAKRSRVLEYQADRYGAAIGNDITGQISGLHKVNNVLNESVPLKILEQDTRKQSPQVKWYAARLRPFVQILRLVVPHPPTKLRLQRLFLMRRNKVRGLPQPQH